MVVRERSGESGECGKSRIPSQRASAVSYRQHVTKHCYPGNMWPSIDMKQNYD